MNRGRRQRMIFVALVIAGVGAATGLVIAAMGENMLYFYSPTQIRAGEAPSGPGIRVGGLVVEGSVQRGQGLDISFSLTDGAATVDVRYAGILPDLFREGQGIVASGVLRVRRPGFTGRGGPREARRELHASRGRRSHGDGEAGREDGASPHGAGSEPRE